MAKRASKNPSKKSRLLSQVAELVGAGKKWELETVDFSDPNRPPTCLEVDFPIVPINEIAKPEMSSGAARKPIYTMQKWWARRSSAVFRAMLLAAATKAPDEPAEAAAKIWRAYYGNHQNNPAFKNLKVADLFMGGGTTLVEGSRLGMNLFGCDLNPVAWFVVKNEITPVDLDEVRRLLAEIEAEVKPYIMPYFACDGPGGERGIWSKRVSGSKDDWVALPEDFDIFSIPWERRPEYRYKGPEIIYTFWAKHGPCAAQGCGHRTPLLKTPVVAIKTLTVSCWADFECSNCNNVFDVERHPARMSPDAPLVVAEGEKSFAAIDDRGEFLCPHCRQAYVDRSARFTGESVTLGGKAKNKKIECTLLMHPDWMKGCGASNEYGQPYGGSATDDVSSTVRWLRARAATLRCVEVRGPLPDKVTCPDTGVTFSTETGNIPKRSTFECQEPNCGRQQDVLESIKKSAKTGPLAPYMVQAYSSLRDAAGFPYGGRFFALASSYTQYEDALREWDERSIEDLKDFWPKTEVPFGFMTGMANGDIRKGHGLTHWWKMFNPLQRLIFSQLLKALQACKTRFDTAVSEIALAPFHRYLQHDNALCFWDIQQDCLAPSLANQNFHPKNSVVQNNPFSAIGRGNLRSSNESAVDGVNWMSAPWELCFPPSEGESISLSRPSVKLQTMDPLAGKVQISCQSSTDIHSIPNGSIDLVITDPPFGGLLHYSELSDFFYVWLRLALKDRYPNEFGPEYTPKTLEAVANRARNPGKDEESGRDNSNEFYQRVLTDCWREGHRLLKPGGILAFTFHHSEDEPWVDVLESLFNAGFYLEATYPIRSDETKGEGEFGSRKVEYDIIHVCRKRIEEPSPVSWAKLRRRLAEDVRQITQMLEHHRQDGLPDADLKVIRRGKALEYFSKHYGKIYIERDNPIDLKTALAGINQLLDDDQTAPGDAPPVLAEPLTRQFLRIFKGGEPIPRNAILNELRGTGIGADDFEKRGWCSEEKKVYSMVDPKIWASKFKGLSRQKLSRDLDQALFLIGANFEGSDIRIRDTLNSPNFKHHPAIPELLDWYVRKGATFELREAANQALTLYRGWMAENKEEVDAQMTLFDLEGLVS
jgi:putative DNA methylase